jgi:hypothetical protein
MRRAWWAATLAVMGTLATAASSASVEPGEAEPVLVPERRGAAPEPTPDPSAETRVLSNERTESRWAFVRRKTFAREEPSADAPVVKKLTTSTHDGTPELVLALRWRRLENGRIWVYVRLPMRPNGSKGWVRREDLGRFRVVDTRFVINRDKLTAKLFKDGRRVLRTRVGIGKPASPTPGGRFYVRERLVPADKNTVYGVFAFGTSAFSNHETDWPGGGIIGVHGTNQPELIPGRVSHGCVRIVNDDIRRLKRKMPLGTPILIR